MNGCRKYILFVRCVFIVCRMSIKCRLLILEDLIKGSQNLLQGKDQVQGMVGELTDKTIGQACQDWLKLSKQRYNNKNAKT